MPRCSPGGAHEHLAPGRLRPRDRGLAWIGCAIARALAAEGWPVGVNYRADERAATASVAQIEDDGGIALAVRADVTVPSDSEELFDTLERRFGRVLVLVNNAGIRADDLAMSLSDSDWAGVLETNLTAAFRDTRRALGGMVRERFGRVSTSRRSWARGPTPGRRTTRRPRPG